jgi:hypothetical protein
MAKTQNQRNTAKKKRRAAHLSNLQKNHPLMKEALEIKKKNEIKRSVKEKMQTTFKK